MATKRAESWVVYHTTVRGTAAGVNAVCDQAEWAALEVARPGGQTLIRAGITSEGEAERLARGTSGDPTPRAPRATFGSSPGHPRPAPAGA